MRKALMPQRAVIARAALGRFAASAALDEDAARIAFVAFAAASGCDAGGQCPDVGRILTAIDRLPAPLATEASAMLAAIPSSGYVNQRWRQYLAALTVAVAILLVALAVSFVLGWRGLTAATIAGICALGLGAVLQFYAAGTTALSWPPLKVWPATFIGVVALTTLIAALIGLAAGRGLRRALAAIVAAEVLWWVVPEALTATGVAVRMQHYRVTDDIVVMIAPIAGAFAVPFAAWATAGLAAALAGPFALDRHRRACGLPCGAGRGRTAVVRTLPQTASLFALIHLPVNLRGLDFADVKSSEEFDQGVPVLVVEGRIVNLTNRIMDVPRLRIAVRNAAGQEVYAWTALAQNPILGPRDSLPFRTRLASPPSDANEVAVRFFTTRDRMAGFH